MFRIARTAPECIIFCANQNNLRGPSRLYRTIRHYSKDPNPRADLCPPPRKKSHAGRYWTLGAITLIGGTIGYAKYDPEFRSWLVGLLPFMDDILKFIFQEEHTYAESIGNKVESIKVSVMGALGFDTPAETRGPIHIEEVPKVYKPPPQVLEPAEKKVDETYTEIRLQKKVEGSAEPAVEIVGDVRKEEPPATDIDISELERRAGETATLAIKGYNKALYALKNYNADVEQIIEQSTIRINPKLSASVKQKREHLDETLSKAEQCAAEAQQYINKLKYTLQYRSNQVPKSTREVVKHNIQKLEDDINLAKKELENERKMADITDKYWEKVEEARKHFSEDLQILFPSINICEKKLNISTDDLSLFLLHAYKMILFYQKELAKLEVVTDAKLKNAVEAAKAGNADVLSEQQVRQEVEKELRQLQMCFQKQCMQVKCETEQELRRQLKLQSEAFADHLKDAMSNKELEMERLMVKKFDEKLEAERCKFKLQLSAIVGRLRGLESAIEARQRADQAAQNATILWSACEALYRSVKIGCPGLPWQEQVRSLATEIAAVKNAAVDGDELVDVVLKGLPKEACTRGVFTEDALRERFLKVEKIAQAVALVPENGAKLPLHILSFLQSFLLVKAQNPISQEELNDETVDFSKLTTIEILERAKYWVDRNNFEQALRYMNLLEGASRTIARQWMHETRILLETQQAANTLMAHAASCGLMYL